jgi:ankyrin repeat protein
LEENETDVKRSDLDGIPFALYAIRNWMFHAGKAEQNGVSQQDIITQFEWPLNNVITSWSTLYSGPWCYDFYYPRVIINCGTTLFHIASGSGLYSVIVELLNHGVDINERDANGCTALHYAASRGNVKVVARLLSDGRAEFAPIAKNGKTPLILAAEQGYGSIIHMLVAAGDDINTHWGEHGPALYAASARGQALVVQWLLFQGADINAQGGIHGNALQAGAASGSKDVVSLLLNAGADINAQGGRYGNALQCAKRFHREDVIKLLVDAGAK